MAEESNAIEELKIKDDLSDANTLTIENEEPNQKQIIKMKMISIKIFLK